MFVVDGMSVNDPLAGGGYGYQIDPSIINEIEVLTGGFNAEYGQAVSGVVNVTTKEGSDRVEGKVSFKRDYLRRTGAQERLPRLARPDRLHRAQEHRHRQGAPCRAPIPSAPGCGPWAWTCRARSTCWPAPPWTSATATCPSTAGRSAWSRRSTRTDFWSPRQQNDWNGLAKWTWHITPHPQAEHQRQPPGGHQPGLPPAGRGLSRGPSWTTWTTTWSSPTRTS